MSSLFALLFLASLGCMVAGLIRPQAFANQEKGRNFTRKHAGLGFGFLAVLFMALTGMTAPDQPKNAAAHSVLQTSAQHIQASPAQKPADKTTTSQVIDTQVVPFTTETHDDANLPAGQTKITQAGTAGVKTLTYAVTYTNSVETNRKLVSETVTTQPVTQIVAHGTHVTPPTPSCTSGTYVNTAGNTVCRPEVSSSAPAGASARCVDGTYSFSQSRRGTCSHHGGVAEWL